MNIICNGEERQVGPETRLVDFIQSLGLAPETVVVEYNGRILSKEEHSRLIEEGACLELIRFVGGGW